MLGKVCSPRNLAHVRRRRAKRDLSRLLVPQTAWHILFFPFYSRKPHWSAEPIQSEWTEKKGGWGGLEFISWCQNLCMDYIRWRSFFHFGQKTKKWPHSRLWLIPLLTWAQPDLGSRGQQLHFPFFFCDSQTQRSQRVSSASSFLRRSSPQLLKEEKMCFCPIISSARLMKKHSDGTTDTSTNNLSSMIARWITPPTQSRRNSSRKLTCP